MQKCNLIESKFSPRPSHGTIELAVLVKGVCGNTGVSTDTHHRTQQINTFRTHLNIVKIFFKIQKYRKEKEKTEKKKLLNSEAYPRQKQRQNYQVKVFNNHSKIEYLRIIQNM